MGMWTGKSLAAMGGALVAATLAACGGDEGSRQQADPPRDAGLGAIKSYLTDHTADLKASTSELARQGRGYYELAKDVSFDYEELLSEHREEVAGLVRDMQKTWREANPQYEEAEGVVAGVEELSEFDVILDAGADGSDPENAVPFDVHLPDGRVLEKPGNFFFLTETSLFGTNGGLSRQGTGIVEPISTATARPRSARRFRTPMWWWPSTATSPSRRPPSTTRPGRGRPRARTPCRRW